MPVASDSAFEDCVRTKDFGRGEDGRPNQHAPDGNLRKLRCMDVRARLERRLVGQPASTPACPPNARRRFWLAAPKRHHHLSIPTGGNLNRQSEVGCGRTPSRGVPSQLLALAGATTTLSAAITHQRRPAVVTPNRIAQPGCPSLTQGESGRVAPAALRPAGAGGGTGIVLTAASEIGHCQ